MCLSTALRSAVSCCAVRTPRYTLIRTLLWLGLAALTCACQTLPSTDRWIELQSENFVITSRLSEDSTRALSKELETFRAAAMAYTPLGRNEAILPLRVYAFDLSTAVPPFTREKGTAGYYLEDIRESMVVVIGHSLTVPKTIIQHEYTHLLMSQQGSLILPRWLSEGFAEFMSTLSVRDEKVLIGAPAQARVLDLQVQDWIPLEDVLDYNGREEWPISKRSLFYAQSWALVHYLVLGAPEELDFNRAVSTYLKQLESGASPKRAAELAFKMSLETLEKRLRAYLRQRALSFLALPVKSLDVPSQATLRRLPPAEAGAQLGALALKLRKREAAESLLKNALRLEPSRARTHADLGRLYLSLEDLPRAQAHLNEASTLKPNDPLILLDLGAYWLHRATKEQDSETRAKLAKKARHNMMQAYKIDPKVPEPYYLFGQTFLLNGQPKQKSIKPLVHAASLVPSQLQVRLELAKAYLAVGRLVEALAQIHYVAVHTHNPAIRAAILKKFGSLNLRSTPDPTSPPPS